MPQKRKKQPGELSFNGPRVQPSQPQYYYDMGRWHLPSSVCLVDGKIVAGGLNKFPKQSWDIPTQGTREASCAY
jgi:hypothetical protein